MPRIIDGDNLLGTWPGRKRSDSERRRVAHEIARLGRRERWRVVVVFDGSPPPALSLGAGVQFSGQGRSADDVILEHLRNESDPRSWIVVTDDRRLADQCRHVGAGIERGARFRRRLLETDDAEKPQQVEDVAYWLEVFGADDDESAT